MAGPLLTGAAREAFERDLAGQSGDETPPPDDTGAPDGGTDPGTGEEPPAPPASHTAGAAAQGKAPKGAPASGEPDFDALSKHPGYVERLNKAAEERAQEYLEAIALKNPQAYEYFYGKKPPPNLFDQSNGSAASAAKGQNAQAKPEDMIAELRGQLEMQGKQLSEFQQERALQRLGDAIQDQFDRHEKIFTHKVWGKDAQTLATYEIRQAIMRNPRADVGKIVDSVADRFKAMESHIRGEYVDSKKGAARTVPAGAGPSGAPVPGEPKTKLNLGRGKNGTQAALAAHIASINANQD